MQTVLSVGIVAVAIFAISILEIPFKVFFNLSLDSSFLEYHLALPFSARGYARLQDGEIRTGRRKRKGRGGDGKAIATAMDKINITKVHVRGIIGYEAIEDAMLQSTTLAIFVGSLLSIIKAKFPFAELSYASDILQEEDSNIFVQTTFFLSVMDIFSIIVSAFAKEKEN